MLARSLALEAAADENPVLFHNQVVGHTSCGGVLAAMSPAPTNETLSDHRIQGWIAPIRQLYLKSTRREIVAFRNSSAPEAHQKAAALTCVASSLFVLSSLTALNFSALVQENVKRSVRNLIADPVVQHVRLRLPRTLDSIPC